MRPYSQLSRIVTAVIVATGTALAGYASWAENKPQPATTTTATGKPGSADVRRIYPGKEVGSPPKHDPTKQVVLPGKANTDGTRNNVTAAQERAKYPDKKVGSAPPPKSYDERRVLPGKATGPAPK